MVVCRVAKELFKGQIRACLPFMFVMLSLEFCEAIGWSRKNMMHQLKELPDWSSLQFQVQIIRADPKYIYND
jgi:hypothetical protein